MRSNQQVLRSIDEKSASLLISPRSRHALAGAWLRDAEVAIPLAEFDPTPLRASTEQRCAPRSNQPRCTRERGELAA